MLAGSGRKTKHQELDDPFAALAKVVAASRAEAERQLHGGYVEKQKDVVGSARKRIVSGRLTAASEKASDSHTRLRTLSLAQAPLPLAE